uniref:Uncharacterized protein n=1 Tax=Brassica oleracea var. oleracea TaxID=109376 RepID=A0A0D3CYV7_BRAOL
MTSLLWLTAEEAAKNRGDGKSSSPTVFRCVEAMIRLKEAPESLACELVTDRRYPQFGKSHVLLMDDKNPRIQSEAKLLYTLWLRYLYATRRKQCPLFRVEVLMNTWSNHWIKELPQFNKLLETAGEELLLANEVVV